MLRSSCSTQRSCLFAFLIAASLTNAGNAQTAPASQAQAPAETAVDPEERARVVERMGEMLEERYVFPDVAGRCAAALRDALAAGTFDDLSDPEAFAAELTTTLQGVSHDKHMRVRVRPPARVQLEQEAPARSRARQLDEARRQNYGFERVERLDGNVGYLDMRYFAGTPRARPTAEAAMAFLANADAIIFDMRKNGGGSPEMIRFICSHLFDERTHLNSLYWREGDRTEEFWTHTDLADPRMSDVPVFVLTSSYTFSGAEEFSYNLKTRERATLVGETTGGGANPGGTFPVNERFGIFIPTGRAINPVTGTNWEGVGVVPHHEMPADDAYDAALEMATKAAEAHREKEMAEAEELLTWMSERRREAERLASDGRGEEALTVIMGAVRRVQAADLIGEPDINMLGYEFLGADQLTLATAIFAHNVHAYPDSANVYDSLGEAYMTAGNTEQAIAMYERSVELDPGNENARTMIRRMKDEDAGR